MTVTKKSLTSSLVPKVAMFFSFSNDKCGFANLLNVSMFSEVTMSNKWPKHCLEVKQDPDIRIGGTELSASPVRVSSQS
jgi:hypothetical protein